MNKPSNASFSDERPKISFDSLNFVATSLRNGGIAAFGLSKVKRSTFIKPLDES